MTSVLVRVYAELNDRLPPPVRGQEVERSLPGDSRASDLLASLGIPPEEVDVILLNGQSVGASAELHDGDRLSIYPVFESFDISPLVCMREKPLRTPRFVLDAHLGKLTAYLRMAGFDAQYRNDYADCELIRIAESEKRTLLSRDRRLIEEGKASRAYFVRNTDPLRQMQEVVRRFDLAGAFCPFTRCLRCNTPVEAALMEEVKGHLPANTQARFKAFTRCPACGKVYWKGSHVHRMRAFLTGIQETSA